MKKNTLHNINIRFFLILFASAGLLMLLLAACEKTSDNIPTEPVTLDALIQEGWDHYANGDIDLAILAFQAALERDVDPNEAIGAYQGLGWSYSRVGKYPQSINNFNFLISTESVESGKYPVVERENVAVTSDAVLQNAAYEDTVGIGKWILRTGADDYLLSISEVGSYSAEYTEKIATGATPNTIEAGERSFSLSKSPVSNPGGTGLGTPLSSSLVFDVSTNYQKDSLDSPVAAASGISTNHDYYLDVAAGKVFIKPRYWEILNLKATYKYYEKTYTVRNFNCCLISLGEKLEDGSDFPVLDRVNYPGGDTFYITGEFFNKSLGGTLTQLDAFAGMSAGYLAQEDFENAIKSSWAAILINEYLEDSSPGLYPYQRNLYDGDTAYDLWAVYHNLAVAYYNLNDFRNAEICVEEYLLPGTQVVDPKSDAYEFELIKAIGTMERPAGWQPPQIW